MDSPGFQISAPVGAKSPGKGPMNDPDDVRKVQDALNAIPVEFGGPAKLLSLDGVAGRLTQQAIQEFQLKHFGWKIADGRVDPGGKTWGRLVELLLAHGGTRWNIRRLEQRRKPEKPFRDTESRDRFYEVFSQDGRQRALYYFQTPDQQLPRGYTVPFDLDGLPEVNGFSTQAPCSVYAFVAVAATHSERSTAPAAAVIRLRLQPIRTDVAPTGLPLQLHHTWLVPSATPGVERTLAGSLRFLRAQCLGVTRQKTPRTW